jgi:hypothetical protein
MRRVGFVLFFAAVLLQACALPSLSGLLPAADTPAPTASATNTLAPSATPTATNTPIPTATVTIVKIPTFDPNAPTATFPPISIILEGGVTATPGPVQLTPTQYKPGAGFVSVTVSDGKIFWGSCKHNKTTITAIVEDEDEVFSVVIFTRVKAAFKDDSTPWTTGNTMHDHRDGTFTYVMYGSDVEGHNHYKNSYVLFQLVAVNEDGEEVGRTHIFNESIALSPCE